MRCSGDAGSRYLTTELCIGHSVCLRTYEREPVQMLTFGRPIEKLIILALRRIHQFTAFTSTEGADRRRRMFTQSM